MSTCPPRSVLHPGVSVLIVQKHDQPTGKLTKGYIQRLLTAGEQHPHGIKVELTTGEVGRVQSMSAAVVHERGRGKPSSSFVVVPRPHEATCSTQYNVRTSPADEYDDNDAFDQQSYSPLGAAAGNKGASPSSKNKNNNNNIDFIVNNMGFRRDHAAEALRRCHGVLDEAIDFLLEHGDAGLDIFVAESYALDFPSMF